MSTQSTMGFKGTPKYMAPETWEENEYNKSIDVYAYSIIVYEIITGEDPFQNFTFQMFYSKVAIKGYRPVFKYPIPNCYRELICRCWSGDPNERPSFSEIVEELKNNEEFIIDDVDKDEYLDYIDYIENSHISFNQSKKFRKVDLLDSSSNKPSMKVQELENSEDLNDQFSIEIINSKEFQNLPSETQEILKQSLISRDNSAKFIMIPANKVETLLNNKSFDSKEFNAVLNKFEQVDVELIPARYKVFESSLISIGNMIKSCQCLKLILFIKEDISIASRLYEPNFDCPTFSVRFDSSFTSIHENMLSKCSFVTQVTIPSSVTEILDSAFNSCTKLTQITIPTSVIKIGEFAFRECSLEKVTIPSSVTNIGENAFYLCSSLKQVQFELPSSLTILEEGVFSECSSLEQITIPSSITQIEKRAFEKCTSMKKLLFEDPSSLDEIGMWAFANCQSLEQLTIPSSVTVIKNFAFASCTSLTEVTVPSTVDEMSSMVFNKCKSLLKLTIPSKFYAHGLDLKTKVIKY